MARPSRFNLLFVAQDIARNMTVQGWIVFEYAVDVAVHVARQTDGSPDAIRKALLSTFARYSRRAHNPKAPAGRQWNLH